MVCLFVWLAGRVVCGAAWLACSAVFVLVAGGSRPERCLIDKSGSEEPNPPWGGLVEGPPTFD